MVEQNTLLDPKGDRQVKDIPAPPHRPLTHDQLFPTGLMKPNWRLLMDHFLQGGILGRVEADDIVKTATKVLQKEPNLLYLKDPVTLVGDIHGQFFDFVKIIEVGGDPGEFQYIFLGDYVDRGAFSVEVVLTLYCIKISNPTRVIMLRGNHECRQMTEFFNFKKECEAKYDLAFYDLVMKSFDAIPIACLLNNRFLAVHGGISPELKSLDDFKNINRFQEIPKSGLFADLVWSDPVDNDDGKCEPLFKFNEVRGCSYLFGKTAVTTFLEKNRLLSILRAHEAQLDGYKMHKWTGVADFPCVITIFSAPNYCDVYNNKGAVIKFENNTLNIQQFNYSAHPYVLPDYLNVFTWSMPFLSEKVSELLLYILELKPKQKDKKVAPQLAKEKLVESADKDQEKKSEVLRKKIQSVARMMKMFKTLRQENEKVIMLKGLCPDNKIPRGLLLAGGAALRDAIESFKRAKKWDSINDIRPGSKDSQLGPAKFSKEDIDN